LINEDRVRWVHIPAPAEHRYFSCSEDEAVAEQGFLGKQFRSSQVFNFNFMAKGASLFFIGIDVSKLTLDMAVLKEGVLLEQAKIANTVAAVSAFLADVKKRLGCTRFNSMLCAEQMGAYNNFLVAAVVKKKYLIVIENPLHLKRSLGLQRGKSDAIDAVRIARYLALHHAALKPWEAPRPVMQQLKLFSSLRKRLIKAKRMFANNAVMEKHFLDRHMQQLMRAHSAQTVQAIASEIEGVERAMEKLIREDERLYHLYLLVISVPNIGVVIATELLLCTNEFKYFNSAKKFASYCGIAPFAYSSGTSIKGKAKVSRLANQEIKSLLHVAAIGSLRKKDSFFALYYERKVKEGKHKLAVLNAIRNKLVHRIFACVLNDRPFIADYSSGQTA
jgi:transposase